MARSFHRIVECKRYTTLNLIFGEETEAAIHLKGLVGVV